MDKRTCSIEGCEGETGFPGTARGLCRPHYRRLMEHGDSLWVRPARSAECSVEGCTSPAECKGWCNKHYKRWQVHGDPLVTTWHQPKPSCVIADCEGIVYGHGLCKMHYERWRIHGSTDDRPTGNYDRLYALDEHYFDQIDTPDKAYWLGFIAADGCVLERGTLAVCLATVDEAHLETLRTALRTDSPVRRYTAKSGKREGTQKATLFVCSRHMTDALISHGITPRKSLTLQAWNGPEHLMRHYWRGLVDGDGTVITGRNRWQVSLVGSKSVVHGFADWVRGVIPGTAATAKPVDTIWFFGVGGRVQCRAVAEALYGDCSTALERKLARATALIAAGPPWRLGHENSPESRLKVSATKRRQHAERKARELEGALF